MAFSHASPTGAQRSRPPEFTNLISRRACRNPLSFEDAFQRSHILSGRSNYLRVRRERSGPLLDQVEPITLGSILARSHPNLLSEVPMSRRFNFRINVNVLKSSWVLIESLLGADGIFNDACSFKWLWCPVGSCRVLLSPSSKINSST